MERYKFVLRRMRKRGERDLYTPALFERDRFFDFRPTDTNLAPPSFEPHYDRIRQRFDDGDVQVVGDKLLPPDRFSTLAVASQFPDARFIFIYRDLLHVASSFERRAQDPSDARWPEGNGHELAFEHWSESFRAADDLVAEIGCGRVLLVRPEVLYQPDARLCEVMFRFLGLEVEPAVRHNFQVLHDKWHERQTKPLALDDEVQASLTARADQTVLGRFDRRLAVQLLPTGGFRGPVNRARQASSARRFDAAAQARRAEMGPPTTLRDEARRQKAAQAGTGPAPAPSGPTPAATATGPADD